MNFFNVFSYLNQFFFNLQNFKYSVFFNFFKKTQITANYFSLNEMIWQEGLLIDFLQKKITDNWLKKFVILSANLFSERVVFDKIVKFYLDLFIWPLHKFFIFEFNNVGGTLFINLYLFFLFIFFIYFFYLFFLMF